MNRWIVVLIFIVFGAGLVFGDGIEDLDGFFWVKMSRTEKLCFVAGWMSAVVACKALIFAQWAADKSYQLTQEDALQFIGHLNAMLDIPGTTADLVDELDRHYSVYGRRDSKIFAAIFFILNKTEI